MTKEQLLRECAAYVNRLLPLGISQVNFDRAVAGVYDALLFLVEKGEL